MVRPKISIREVLLLITLIAVCLGWVFDRRNLQEGHQAQVDELDSKIARYQKVENGMLKLRTGSLIDALKKRVDLRTLVGGVAEISIVGFEFNGDVNVTFNDGEKVVRSASHDEFTEARKMLAERLEE